MAQPSKTFRWEIFSPQHASHSHFATHNTKQPPSTMPPKRVLGEISGNIQPPPPPKSQKPQPKNIGGASTLGWFNQLLRNAGLEDARKHLADKIADKRPKDNGCMEVAGFTEGTRPVADKRFGDKMRAEIKDIPARFSPYTIAMLEAGNAIPDFAPPSLPDEFRQVKHRGGVALGDKAATWVLSHLCHNKRCVNPEHLRWEPSWFNRMRDNCEGGGKCVHRSDRCLNAHRASAKVVDWTEYIK